MSDHVATIRRYIADASDWGDAAVGNAEAMQAYEREGLAALDALVAENQQQAEAATLLEKMNDMCGAANQRLLAERDMLREEVRVREQSQIPVIPAGAQQKMERLEVENQRLRERWHEADGVARALHEENQRLRAALDGTP